MKDLTIVYYTVRKIPSNFNLKVLEYLAKAARGSFFIAIEQPETILPSHVQIYKNALEGARRATTKYIAFAEDDVLYTHSHFTHRPSPGVFAYNENVWSIYTWVTPPIFSYKGRRNMYGLICERDLFIEAMEERFAKFPDEKTTPIESWSEPGKYEDNLGVTQQKTKVFYSKDPLVAFSHETALSFKNLGKRKRLGDLRAVEVPYWGRAEDVIKYYE